jgi:hypothetical protein
MANDKDPNRAHEECHGRQCKDIVGDIPGGVRSILTRNANAVCTKRILRVSSYHTRTFASSATAMALTTILPWWPNLPIDIVDADTCYRLSKNVVWY